MMFVELDSQHRFVQYHANTDTVSAEHTDTVIKISDDLYEALQEKMPWKLLILDEGRVYDVADMYVFEEILPNTQISDKERIAQLEQMINLILMGEV